MSRFAKVAVAVPVAALLFTLAWAVVYPDSIVGTLIVRGQGSPVKHLTLNEGTNRDICTVYDLPTDQSICWDASDSTFTTTAPIRIDQGLDYTNDQNLMLLSLGYTSNDPRIRWDGSTADLVLTGWGLRLESDDGADGSPVQAFRAIDSGVTFGPPSGSYTFTFGHATTGDTAVVKSPFVFDGSAGATSPAYSDYWLPGAGGTAWTLFDGSGGGGTTKMMDGYSDGTNGFLGWYPLGSTTRDSTFGRTASGIVTLDGASLQITSPRVLQGDRFSGSCSVSGTLAPAGTAIYCSIDTVALTATYGFPLVRAGSLLGVSSACTTSLSSGTYVLRTEVELNGSVALTCDLSTTGNARKAWGCTQARGTSTFSANDFWALKMQLVSGTSTPAQCISTVDIVYDN